MNYSPLFHTLYDEKNPRGRLGDGTHYSVLKAVQWVDKYKKQLQVPSIQNFAIIWDGDHDERVIDVIERAYMNVMFAPVLFIGERKATVTAVVDSEFYRLTKNDRASYTRAWQDMCNSVCENTRCADSWVFELRTVDDPELKIIAEPHDKIATYLQNINNLWNIGLNSYVHTSKNYDSIFD